MPLRHPSGVCIPPNDVFDRRHRGAANSGVSLSSRGMKGMTCPEALGTDGSVSYVPNQVMMPDRERESHPFLASVSNKPPGRPAKLSQLYPDNILMWDVTGIGPNYSSQYVTGYEVDSGGTYSQGSFIDPKRAARRYRNMAEITFYLTPDLYNDVPIYPGANRDIGPGSSSDGLRGNIRWRHGKQDMANFLFSDGTVRTMRITTGTPGTPGCKGDVLHKFLRPKAPSGFKPNG